MAPLDGRWAPSRYHKELQRAIAFRSYISILRSGVRKKQTQESILERLYHKGETNEHGDIIQEALVDQAVKGEGQFAGLCDRHSYISIDGATGERKEEVRLVVQDGFTRTLSIRFVIGESFTRESLSLAKLSDNKKLVSGRTLRAGAEIAHKNGKKAYEYAMDFLDENLELPSNKSMDDYETYVLSMMWKDQKQAAANRASATEGQLLDPTVDVGTRPNDWIFDGWFAFRMYGPIVEGSMMEYKTDAFADPPEQIVQEEDDDDEAKMKTDELVALAGVGGVVAGVPGLASTAFSLQAMTAPPPPAPRAAAVAVAPPPPSRKRSAAAPRPGPGPFVAQLSDEEKRHAMSLVMERVASRERLAQAEIDSLQRRAESLEKTMEMELKIAMASAPTPQTEQQAHPPEEERWREYRSLQRELTNIWNQVHQKHQESKLRDAYECEIVNEYLSAVTSKKFRFDPKPP